jgi:hypothetical protein
MRPGRPRHHLRRRGLLAGLTLALALVFAGTGAIGALAGGGAPTVETEHPNSLARTSVELTGSVNPNSSAVSECYFEYGTSESSLTSTAACSYGPGEGETVVPVNASVTGLTETETYFYRLHAKNGDGESDGSVHSFTTLPTAPGVNTEAARPVGRTTATLDGFVDPNDSEVTECFFEYGTVPGTYSGQIACSSAPGSGSEPVQVHATLEGLSESKVYYYRVVARNAYALEHGGRTNFETLPAAPRSNTEPAINVAHTSATLRGFVTPNDATIESCSFEWGSHSVEENSVPCEQSGIGAGESPVAVTAQLTGLSESTTYHFKLVSTNSRGTTVGGGLGFSTLPFVPKTVISRPTELSDETAQLNAKVNPQDEAITACAFEYGTTPALGKSASCKTLPPAGERYTQVSAAVTGLSPTTTYLVRVRVADASGVTYSREESFSTFKAGLLPTVTKIKPRKGNSNGGTTVTVKGANLLHATGVLFGETETTDITSDTADSLTVIAPPGVGTVDVIVITESGESTPNSEDEFTYGKPIITAVSPNHGGVAGGTEVTVTGYGFEPGNAGTTFVFNKLPATSVECVSSTSCTMMTPAASKGKAGKAKVTAKVNGKGSSASSAASFTYET